MIRSFLTFGRKSNQPFVNLTMPLYSMIARIAVILVLAGIAVGFSNPATAQCPRAHYRNVDGECVHRPHYEFYRPNPAGQCADDSHSESRHRRGTCSYHGGVKKWYRDPEQGSTVYPGYVYSAKPFQPQPGDPGEIPLRVDPREISLRVDHREIPLR
jgi:Protein of unknown function (DUF3761)